MNNRGQALIEFVLILPIAILILFAIIDFGFIFSTKSKLENDSADIINLYNNGTSIEEIKTIYSKNNINYYDDGKYSHINITTKVNIITPGLNRIIGNPYIIRVERIIPNVE